MDKVEIGEFCRFTLTPGEFVGILLLPLLLNVVFRFHNWSP